MLPMPFDESQTLYRSCCGKIVCGGCAYDQIVLDAREGRRTFNTLTTRICPFCRSEQIHETLEQTALFEREMSLANAGNHTAIWRIGKDDFDGKLGVKQDKEEGIKWFRRAAEAGNSGASTFLGVCYMAGDGLEQDIDMALEYLQKGAELGKVTAFALIGRLMQEKGAMNEAYLNFRKAALCGVNNKFLFSALREGYKNGYITKEEYALTLRENQKASNEMKSESREMIKKVMAEA